ncbi:MAG TPA: histidine kinase [Solirubrobacteraceae bacterium]
MKYALIAITAALLGVASTVAIAVHGWGEMQGLTAAIFAAGTFSWVGVGIYAWERRPQNPLGKLMVAVGFIFWTGSMTLIAEPLPFTIGLLLGGLFIGTVAHMLLAFPSGRLEPRDGRLVLTTYVLLAFANVSITLIGGAIDLDDPHPRNLLELGYNESLGKALYFVFEAFALALSVWLIRELSRRMRLATPAQRRALTPVLLSGMIFIDALALALAMDMVGLPDGVVMLPNIVGTFVFIALPFAFVLGLVRSRWFRAGAVGDLVERLNSDRRRSLRDSLATALGDADLQLLYWLPRDQRYVDEHGTAVDMQTIAGRAITDVDRDGRRIGAIVHDPALLEDPDLVQAAGAAAALAVENERLEAELRARVQELERSRAKVIEVGLAERRRLERDLHDGAQQRLVALGLQVSMARTRIDADPGGAQEMLDQVREELRLAQEELRELARGIHPAILTDRGLGPAVESLAQRATIEVDVTELPDERLPANVEAIAYFVVAESLTNVAKHAPAARAAVRVSRVNGHAVIEVSDDGPGAAKLDGGSGLRGLADRLAAVDGRLQVHSPLGAGTTIRAEIPCASS